MYALTALRRHLAQLVARAEQPRAAPVVVAAAVVDVTGTGSQVLAQQRAYPAAVAGRWELPGGQVGPDVPLPDGGVLRIYLARLADPAARPVPVEHAALRWVPAAELPTLDWLDADRAVLPDLERVLR
jgi:8-oxo-dGTP diphosphatase